MNTLGCFIPEMVIITFILINFVLAFLIKKHTYKKAKAVTGIGILLAGISIFNTQINIQENALSNMFISNIFTICFKCFILISAVLIITASHNLIREHRNRAFEFFAYFLIGILSAFLLISSNDIILTNISLIILCCSCFKLISFKQTKKTNEVSTIYLYSAVLSALFFLIGSILLYSLASKTNYTLINSVISVFSSNINYTLSGTFILCSIIILLGLLPFNNNITKIFKETSSGICLYLSLIPSIACIVAISRLFVFIYPINPIIQILALILSLLAILGIIIKSLKETNIKILYASAYIINISLFLTAISAVDVFSLSSAIIGIFTYIFTMAGLWSSAIIFRTRYKSDDITSYSGLFYNRPYFTFAAVICILSLIGFPPTGGFISRLYEYIALSKIDFIYFVVLTIILILMTLFIFIFSKYLAILFQKNGNSDFNISRMFIIPKLTLYISALIIILSFVYADNLIKLSQLIAYYI